MYGGEGLQAALSVLPLGAKTVVARSSKDCPNVDMIVLCIYPTSLFWLSQLQQNHL